MDKRRLRHAGAVDSNVDVPTRQDSRDQTNDEKERSPLHDRGESAERPSPPYGGPLRIRDGRNASFSFGASELNKVRKVNTPNAIPHLSSRWAKRAVN